MNQNDIQSPDIKAFISQVAELNRQAANLIQGDNAPEENSDKPQTENKCDYVRGKLVAGPNVCLGLNNSGLIFRIFNAAEKNCQSEHVLKIFHSRDGR